MLIWGYEPSTEKWIPIQVDSNGVLQVFDPKVGSLISYDGTTTADGAPAGTTLICSDLTTKPDYNGNLVIITSGDYEGQARDINGVTTGGTVTPASAFGGQIVSGVTFVIVGIRTVPAEVAAIEAKLDHASHGLAALKTLIDAIEGKLDVPANFMADVSALALEATLGTHDTDIKALLATIAAYIDTEVAAILAAVDTEVAAIETKLDTVKGSTGIFYEQADAAVNINAVNTGETDVFHLSAASTRYIVRSLRLKCADPGANTVTVRLYELVNDVLTEVESFDIDATNFGRYHSLTELFGLFALAGDELKVTVRASAGGPYSVTGQYSHGKTNV